jgi:hypothetical protein
VTGAWLVGEEGVTGALVTGAFVGEGVTGALVGDAELQEHWLVMELQVLWSVTA